MMKTLDEKRLERAIDDMADVQVTMHLTVRRFPGFWVPQPLPFKIKTTDQAEEYARYRAAEDGVRVGLIIRDSGTVWFDENGRVVSRTHGDER